MEDCVTNTPFKMLSWRYDLNGRFVTRRATKHRMQSCNRHCWTLLINMRIITASVIRCVSSCWPQVACKNFERTLSPCSVLCSEPPKIFILISFFKYIILAQFWGANLLITSSSLYLARFWTSKGYVGQCGSMLEIQMKNEWSLSKSESLLEAT